MKTLVWLASYPRSGNTWLRVFLTNLMNPGEHPASINELYPTTIVKSCQFLENTLGYDVEYLTPQEVSNALPSAIRWHAQNNKGLSFHKVHDLKSNDIILEEYTRCIIYIIRNPLDVCVSFARFLGIKDLDKAVEIMSNPEMLISEHPNTFPTQFPQCISSWSEHVRSWTENGTQSLTSIRYEDMLNQSTPTFSRVAKVLGIASGSASITTAIEKSEFNHLHSQELSHSFRERPKSSNRFFSSGKTGNWRSVLNENQVSKIITDHKDCMKKFGYLDPSGNPVF